MDPAVQPAAPAPAAPPPASPAAAAPAAVPPAAPPAAPAPGAPATPPAAPAGAAPPAAPAGAAPEGQPPKPAAEPGKKPDDAPAALEIKLPEGAKFDEKVLGEFKAIMGNSKTTPAEKAQAVVELQHNFIKAQEQAFTEQVQRARVADLDKLKGDSKYGGAMFDKTRADARSILERSERGKAVSKKLELYGLDCDPDFTVLFAEFASLVSEDTTSSRVPNPVPSVQARPTTQTERMANRYDKNKK